MSLSCPKPQLPVTTGTPSTWCSDIYSALKRGHQVVKGQWSRV